MKKKKKLYTDQENLINVNGILERLFSTESVYYCWA